MKCDGELGKESQLGGGGDSFIFAGKDPAECVCNWTWSVDGWDTGRIIAADLAPGCDDYRTVVPNIFGTRVSWKTVFPRRLLGRGRQSSGGDERDGERL